MHAAVDEMGTRETFRGYGPEQGYDFLVEAIRTHDYASRGVDIAADEIFVSDGSKCDSGNIQEIFALTARIAVTDPVYPVYVDSNVMAGRTPAAVRRTLSGPRGTSSHLEGRGQNRRFQPRRPPEPVDVVYLCSRTTRPAPSRRERSSRAGSRGEENDAVILFDAAYESYISIRRCRARSTRIPGARDLRPRAAQLLQARGLPPACAARSWSCRRRHGVGADGARVSLSAVGRAVTRRVQRRVVRRAARRRGGVLDGGARANHGADRVLHGECAPPPRGPRRGRLHGVGGMHAPYIWLRTHGGATSWEFFDRLLTETQVVGTPGSGFGPGGEGYFRLSGFNSRANIEDAIGRIRRVFG